MAFLPNEPYIPSEEASGHVPHAFYSHGLEKIYALESIDVRSIRKITSASQIETVKIKPETALEDISDQLEFDFSISLKPFIYREPIQVLGFSKRIEKWLIEQGKLTIEDLLGEDKQTVIVFKGIGQGHSDEIASKLQQYLKAHESLPSQKIDITSWLKTILADLEPKKSAALLEYYSLPIFASLSPAENAELRKFTSDQRVDMIREALHEVTVQQKKENILNDVKQIADTYIKPWMYRRASISSREEIIDQFLKLSGFHPHLEATLEFISAAFFESHFLFDPFLFTVDEGLYCHNMESAEAYYDVMQIAGTYFYRHDLIYPLQSLIDWVNRELAKNWRACPENFVERTMRLSKNFRIRKDQNDQLTIKLS